MSQMHQTRSEFLQKSSFVIFRLEILVDLMMVPWKMISDISVVDGLGKKTYKHSKTNKAQNFKRKTT